MAADQVATVVEQLSQVKDSVMDRVSSAVQSARATHQTATPEALKHVQNKLIAYCRYTNLDVLTPDSLVEKVQTQLDENSLEYSAIAHLDLEAIKQVLDRRQGLKPAQQRALLDVFQSLSASPQPALQAPRRWAIRSGQSAQHLTETLATQVAYYLKHQDKSAFSPTQMARDLTQLTQATVGSFPKKLPQLESLFDKTVWQRELEKRRDLTTDEIQHILSEAEAAWQHSLQQVNSWAESAWADLQETLDAKSDELLETASQQVTEKLASAQQALENQVDAVKTDLQIQAEVARGQVAIAAWWLLISLLLSGASAGASGWLAVMY
ncbi:hypothetical protein IQ260_02095 [Leptolyngbya cf. ectocarpi LEGE 11479]|uniref:Uncharacterized protein n=1 Tax=Leptolyngbya cf. ectocarpi LEGE 11479 TaxID=1828722 RepID=A0A928WXW8_LEPEC|nr:hypothetical protein [Leptolyngbya ectocarpi]MBE9065439.1 hypothetical protein [Leptolyngbya cf. ectocarpi LEGE 11479]